MMEHQENYSTQQFKNDSRQPNDYSKELAAVFRVSRKQCGFTQTEIARELCLSQSKVSKIEAGLLSPTVTQWLHFCRLVKIPYEAVEMGFIDREEASIPSKKFRIPTKYQSNPQTRVRMANVLLKYFQNTRGEQGLVEFLSHAGFDPDFFVDLQHQVNFQFVVDMLKEIKVKDGLGESQSRALAKNFLLPEVHGRFMPMYRSEVNPQNLTQLLVGQYPHYERNYQCSIKELNADRGIISFRAESHMQDIPVDSDIGKFICSSRAYGLSEFISGFSKASRPVNTREIECVHSGDQECLYDIQYA